LPEGNNNIVSSKHCPLQESETTVNQFFADVPVCKHHKIRDTDFICVYFFGVIFDEGSLTLRCSYNKK